MPRPKNSTKQSTELTQSPAPTAAVATSKQNLSAIIKAARNHMRKDHGLSGELDRLPHLTWLMFLKFLDDLERTEEAKTKLRKQSYQPIIAAPYRWRDWALGEKGLTGTDLLVFIREQRATRPDGSEGLGLIPYLSKLQGSAPGDRASVVAKVFHDVTCNFRDGAQLREVVTEINKIGFTSRDEVHTLSYLYESMLKEMRDAAGDSGEFYTPRPVVNFLVKAVDPRLGETVLDPACGTAGFLVSAFEYLKPQATTPAHLEILHQRSILGGEVKPLPYLLAQMNLLLHGMERVHIAYGDAFAKPIGEYGPAEEVDVILTNPPFGGQVKDSVLSSFPPSRRTSDTALLFFQVIMARLRRSRTLRTSGRFGRAAVVVPNGTLSELGVAALIKRDLLTEFNLHTIIRLPAGAFAPYTDIPTNLLIFDSSRATTDIWYYELPTPGDRKKYSKTNPIEGREFDPVLEWMRAPAANEHSWKLAFSELHSKARAKAARFEEQVNAEEAAAREAKARIVEAKAKLSSASGVARDRWKALLESAQEAERTALTQAREAQAQWDAIYWPVFNLDHKNPNAADTPDLLPPTKLAERLIAQAERVAEILRAVKVLVQAGPHG
ncbi:N-6 DNA methylase [Sorangium sp. KYC3313]|uniref:class I SAM-dependent DNA methyltransferase n=1 Tax=Sorangium sp. KYC3313 TaxID=3449740 RepID=UPI003F891DCA